MNWKLEVVVVPVSDVDRSKHFYAEKLGFAVDSDVAVGETMRVVQLTPPGSACSITIGPLVVDEVPRASARMQLSVHDIEAAHAELVARGANVSAIQHFENGVPTAGRGEPYNSFIFFDDPDGNGWAIQESPLVTS
jgi:catechol 2,3-dioxygenase-like lactoylglutathione lyase family enzyme